MQLYSAVSSIQWYVHNAKRSIFKRCRYNYYYRMVSLLDNFTLTNKQKKNSVVGQVGEWEIAKIEVQKQKHEKRYGSKKKSILSPVKSKNVCNRLNHVYFN